MVEQAKFCSNCGTGTTPNNAYCTSCGASTDAHGQPHQTAIQVNLPPDLGTNKRAVWSLVLGILGLFTLGWAFLGLIAGPVAIWLGTVAKKQVKISDQSGHGLAVAGVILGIIVTVLSTTGLILVAGN